MAVDSNGSRLVLITLLVATGVLAYYYWDASSSTSKLFGDVERVTRQWASANRTLADLRLELEGCKAQVKVLEDEKNRLKGEAETKDKTISEKTAAEAKAQEEVKKLTEEKTKLEESAKTANAATETCKKDCEEKVKQAKESCSQKKPEDTGVANASADKSAAPAQPQAATTK